MSETICGETIDHDERITYEDEECVQWVCERCGAEFWEDKEAERG